MSVMSVVFRPGGDDGFIGIEHVSLGVCRRHSMVGVRASVTIDRLSRIDTEGTHEENLPEVLELTLSTSVYLTPWGGAIIILPEKVIFFDP